MANFFNVADCGAPPPPVNGYLLQPHTNTTEGSMVVFQCDSGFVPEGVMTAVCGRDGQWFPDPGGITCSPRPVPTSTQTFTEAFILTPSATPDPTRGESELLLLCNLVYESSANIMNDPHRHLVVFEYLLRPMHFVMLKNVCKD